jgi:hypothetical protein
MKNNLDDLTDDELYASYEAFKALIDAGLSKEQALSRTGLTAQIVKDFETEEEGEDYKSEFEDSWEDEEENEGNWKEEDDDFDANDDEWSDDQYSDDYGSNNYDDRY